MTGPFGFVLLCLAVWRVTRLVTLDTIWEGTRDRLDRWFVAHWGHLGDKLADLITCPFCVSVWASAAGAWLWWMVFKMEAPVAWGFACAGACSIVAHVEDD